MDDFRSYTHTVYLIRDVYTKSARCRTSVVYRNVNREAKNVRGIGYLCSFFLFFMVMNCWCLMWRELLVVALPYAVVFNQLDGHDSFFFKPAVVVRPGYKVAIWGRKTRETRKRGKTMPKKKIKKKLETGTEGLKRLSKTICGGQTFVKRHFCFHPNWFLFEKAIYQKSLPCASRTVNCAKA